MLLKWVSNALKETGSDDALGLNQIQRSLVKMQDIIYIDRAIEDLLNGYKIIQNHDDVRVKLYKKNMFGFLLLKMDNSAMLWKGLLKFC